MTVDCVFAAVYSVKTMYSRLLNDVIVCCPSFVIDYYFLLMLALSHGGFCLFKLEVRKKK